MSANDASHPKARHFSMIRGFHLADFFTLGNAACGVAAVFLSMLYMSRPAGDAKSLFYLAAIMAPAAFLFDVLDGRIARWRRQHSAMGRELDSLADVISFGLAPASLAFAAGMQGGWDWICLIYFVCCGVSRLARYNVTAESLSAGADKVAYFEGTPIPTSVVLTGILAFAAWKDQLGEVMLGGVWQIAGIGLHPLALLFVVSGSLMISKTFRIPKF
ncbi:CDP-alcohol phosphatidyltransferase family protein [Undibacterium terreum]|uniref:CDP-diacylglycerol--serine O-phosphatidyltransferase n=1 Tax=Undibacterium terreum TaxID=1224302 RepID=A0A916U7S2_9BURK|nr:CDP-alcohol phosphatidyltransferase family protein [Undibacterium terreum]GGC61159.1 CDP-diacylglycerol--serine O-phosphatidyltransferase [Undibacterium terreum]